MSIITPTIGRRVWFRPSDAIIKSLGMTVHDKAVPLDAGIVYVWSDRMINLDITDHAGAHFPLTSVTLIHGDEPAGPMPFFYAEWMPYQKVQAVKTETSLCNGVEGLLGARIPILEQVTDLCYAIEKCGASPELTDAVTKASALREPISVLVRQALALGVGAGIVSVDVSPQLPVCTYGPKAGCTGCPKPATSDSAIEQEIIAKGLTAPRITPADIQANIASEHYFTAADGVAGATDSSRSLPDPQPLGLLTFCVLVLKNGFTVTGESACASPENFNAEIGRQIARQNAVQKIWMLEGYLLKERLHARRDVGECGTA